MTISLRSRIKAGDGWPDWLKVPVAVRWFDAIREPSLHQSNRPLKEIARDAPDNSIDGDPRQNFGQRPRAERSGVHRPAIRVAEGRRSQLARPKIEFCQTSVSSDPARRGRDFRFSVRTHAAPLLPMESTTRHVARPRRQAGADHSLVPQTIRKRQNHRVGHWPASRPAPR